MTKLYATYHAAIGHNRTICHDVDSMVHNFGSFEVCKTTNFIKKTPSKVATEFWNKSISLQPCWNEHSRQKCGATNKTRHTKGSEADRAPKVQEPTAQSNK